MGRIKTQLIKRITMKLLEEYKPKFKDSFNDNKSIVSELTDVGNKKLRNMISGYITRLVKKKDSVYVK